MVLRSSVFAGYANRWAYTWQKKEFDMQKCEVCGENATHGVQDLKRFDNMLSGFVEHVKDGLPHYFCETHKRDSQTSFGGTIYTEEEQARVREMWLRPTPRVPDAGDSA